MSEDTSNHDDMIPPGDDDGDHASSIDADIEGSEVDLASGDAQVSSGNGDDEDGGDDQGSGEGTYAMLPLPSDIGVVERVELEDELKTSYLDYAMSVIVSRALPDARDGLKPVHRRILYAMHEGGYGADKPYRKSARIVGDVIGKYHPHSDVPIYEALVRMAQEFSLREVLLDGQGNFGSVDGDPPAAMRYTEIRLKKIANTLMDDIDKDTVDFQPNYDGSETEPTVLPSRLPNLLLNGSGGIAVGMATNIPPHNLGEILDACQAMLRDPSLSDEALLGYVHGPDFPTAGIILGRSGIRSAYLTGRGRVVIRGRVEVESMARDRSCLVITEIPYQVNKSTLIEKIAELAREKRVEGIGDLRDESDRSGMRIVVELKRDAIADHVKNQLFQYSQLQTAFSCNFVALNRGRPEVFTLRSLIQAFLAFREEVVVRRSRFLLNKARNRAHIVAGLSIAVANIDEVIRIIRHAPNPAAARQELMARHWQVGDMAPLLRLIDDPRHRPNEDGSFCLSIDQVKAIMELRLHRLTALGRDEIGDELRSLAESIKDYLDILASRERLLGIVADELSAVKDMHDSPRKTEIIDDENGGDLQIEDLIKREEVVVTVSRLGYVKRVPLSTYRAQKRGGKGRSGMTTREEDYVTRLFVGSTHTPVLFFTSSGKVFKLKVWRLPAAQPQGRGKPLINLLPLQRNERLTSILDLPEEEADQEANHGIYLIFATRLGYVRRNRVEDFLQVNRSGKLAMRLGDDDEILDVLVCRAQDDVFLTTAAGKCVRFPATSIRVFEGRGSRGVRGIRLAKSDRVISMSVLDHVEADSEERTAYLRHTAQQRRMAGDETASGEEVIDSAAISAERIDQLHGAEQFVLTVAENGFGKRTSSYEYRISGRGIQGVGAMAVNDRNGQLAASFPVSDSDQVMLVTDIGRLIRIPIKDVRISGRTTQGVRLFNIQGDERIVGVERISDSDEVDDEDGVI